MIVVLRTSATIWIRLVTKNNTKHIGKNVNKKNSKNASRTSNKKTQIHNKDHTENIGKIVDKNDCETRNGNRRTSSVVFVVVGVCVGDFGLCWILLVFVNVLQFGI